MALSPKRVQVIEALLKSGKSIHAVSKELHHDRVTIRGIKNRLVEKGELGEGGATKGHASPTEPIPYDMLSENAQRALEDFGYFFKRYIAPLEPRFVKFHPDGELPPISKEMAGLLENADEGTWTLCLVHPGLGKTTIILALILWLICRNRNVHGFYITKSLQIAKGRMRWLKAHMERNEALINDYGRFKPNKEDEENLWTAERIVVAGTTDISKEATLAVFGAGQGIYGTRVDFIIADDIIDITNANTKAQKEELQEWWDTQVVSRLEGEGKGFVVGTRLGPTDLYGYMMSQINDDGDRVFRVIRYKAHDLGKCDGKEHTQYPEGCLLDPGRWPLRRLNNGIHSGPVWALVYQQEDVPADDVLVENAWIQGGVDMLGMDSPGCLDHERSMFAIPKNFHPGQGISVITMDPSPTRFWSVSWRIIEPQSDGRPIWHIIAHKRARMSPSDLLDFKENGLPVGMLEDWRNKAAQAGFPIKYLIPESNVAQRWLFQSFLARRWGQMHGITVYPHVTTINKGDPQLGVWTIRLRYRDGKVRIPWGDPNTRSEMSVYVTEHTNYPHLDTDDTVMDSWFLHFNEDRILTRTVGGFIDSPTLPPYLLARRGFVNPDTQATSPATLPVDGKPQGTL